MGKHDEFLIVDGYNVIHAWQELAKVSFGNLEEARSKLIEVLSEYRGIKGIQVVVVFDAHLVKAGREKMESENGITIIFSAEGETADSVIERLVNAYLSRGKVFVATSDWDQQKIIFGKGAYRLPARELIEDITEAKNCLHAFMESGNGRRGLLSYRIDPDIQAKLERWRRGK